MPRPTGKKFDKRRQQQNPLFKRKKFCRFTAANVEYIDYNDRARQ
jgi:small subunit ribosomal protein S18